MTDWIRRSYDGVGLTQSPPGTHLAALQEPYIGKVILCIDVSSSMGAVEGGRSRLQHAIAGAERFVEEATGSHYRVGLILWNTGVSVSVPASTDPSAVLAGLRGAYASGGTNVTPTLAHGIEQLGALTGDRVLAIFGDGDLGDQNSAVAMARNAAARGIRIIVRGLGEHAAAQLNLIATDAAGPAAAAAVADARGIEGAIASMVRELRQC